MINLFISIFIAMFVIVDPIGTAALFAALTGNRDERASRRVAYKAVIIAICVLIGFSLIGQYLLQNMGISLSAFRIAGGILLFVTAFRMINGSHDSAPLTRGDGDGRTTYKDVSDIAIFPLAIPLLAGPGCMTAALLHMSETIGWGQKLVILATITCVEILALLCMLTAGRMVRMLGAGGCSLLARLMGILLAALALQFIADGVVGFQHTL